VKGEGRVEKKILKRDHREGDLNLICLEVVIKRKKNPLKFEKDYQKEISLKISENTKKKEDKKTL